MKTLNILLTIALVSAASLTAEEGMFKLSTKVVVLPMKEFPGHHKLDGLITDDEMRLFIREISEINGVTLTTMPWSVVKLNKVALLKHVSEKTVTRMGTDHDEKIGYSITYRLESIDGVFTLHGIFNHSEVDDGKEPGVVAINTKEIIFKRACELDKTILVSNGDTHVFITLERWNEEEEEAKN